MSHKYNPTVSEVVDAYDVAYGELSLSMLIGALYGHLKTHNPESIETLYKVALDRVAEDMKKAGQL